MTDPGYRHLVLIIDRSGSMLSVKDDTEGGIASFLEEQRKVPGRATVSLYQFDTDHDEVFSFAAIGGDLGYTLTPRGGTALLDAVGFAVTRTGEALAAMPESDRPGEVVVLIATDGHENSSREYSRPRVREMITRQQGEFGWTFVFLGANQDAFAEAGSMGIPAAATIDYSATSSGTAGAYASASGLVTRVAAGGPVAFTEAERTAAAGG